MTARLSACIVGAMLKLGMFLIIVSVAVGEVIRQIRIRRDVALRAVPFSQGATGAEFARLLLRLAGLHHVKVVESSHLVTDHYVTGTKVLRLSPGRIFMAPIWRRWGSRRMKPVTRSRRRRAFMHFPGGKP